MTFLSRIQPKRRFGLLVFMISMSCFMLSGCRSHHAHQVNRMMRPHACPACGANEANCCVCFPHDVAAGYHETAWSVLEESVPAACSDQFTHESPGVFVEIEQIPMPKE